MKKINIKTEIAAGITTFFTMVYIVIVNPSVLSDGGTGMPFSGVLTATVSIAFLMTLLMGVYAKLPFAMAPGMGMNAFFTYTIIIRNQIAWPLALGIVFWSGILFVLCSLTPIRLKIAKSVPENLRLAAATGIGIFLCFIGFKNSGLVIADPVTFVRFGGFTTTNLFTLVGLGFMILLLSKKSPVAFLSGIGVVTLLGYLSGDVHVPKVLFSRPDFESVFLKMDLVNSLKLAFVPSMIALLFTDLFDSVSGLMSCSQALGLKDSQGQPKNLRQGLIVDAWATLLSGVFGTSAATTFVESAAGIEVGGRTGLTSVVTALCFLPCFFIAPLAGMVPGFATAPVLILVGALMFRTAGELKLDRFEEFVPAFLTTVLIPLTFSITQGILWGLIAHVCLYVAFGRRKEIPLTLYFLATVAVVMLGIDSQR